MKEVATERWDLQEGSDWHESVVVDLQDQRLRTEGRKACEGLG